MNEKHSSKAISSSEVVIRPTNPTPDNDDMRLIKDKMDEYHDMEVEFLQSSSGDDTPEEAHLRQCLEEEHGSW